SRRSSALIDHLEELIIQRGAPTVLRSDNGPEFISKAVMTWASTRTALSYIPPGQPWRNGYVELFNARLRDECLNINSFYSLLHAQVISVTGNINTITVGNIHRWDTRHQQTMLEPAPTQYNKSTHKPPGPKPGGGSHFERKAHKD